LRRALRSAFAGLAFVVALPARAADVAVLDVPSAAAFEPARLKPGTLAFSDGSGSADADGMGGLIRFQDWARTKPVQKELLSLYPAYAEPTVTVTVNGLSRPYTEKLHMYVAEARFVLARPPDAVDLSHAATLDFIAGIDPAIAHHAIAASEAEPQKDPALAYNRRPDRPWCEAQKSLCIASRYALEGKLPVGIRLANKLEDGGKQIADFIAFQSELRLVPSEEAAGLGRLTGLSTPVAGAVEESLFYVNQMMQFGKFLAILQADPGDPRRSVVTAFVALGIETDVLEKKREFERVPVLRNLVPVQVLMGRSSFNTGASLSAGLPSYSRNRLKAVAGLLQKD
jgi:hypothetical protein